MGFTELTKDFPGFSGVPQPGADLDYSRWQNGGSTIVLHAVPWSADYSDVIGFGSANARDTWFDGATHERYEIAKTAYIPYGASSCRVELSSARVACFNYIEIRTDAAPTPGDAFNGQVPPGVTRAYYFIRGFKQLAPDTCEIYLDLDVWTTFIFDFRFGQCWLDRGHIGVASTDAGTYLANPSANTQWLLAPDIDFGGSKMATDVKQCDMWQGDCSVLVGIRAGRAWLESAPTLTVTGASGVSFYDIEGARWGADAGISAAVPAQLAPVDMPSIDYGADLQATHFYIVADATTFFENIEQSYAYVYNAIEAVYTVPANLVTPGEPFTALGSTLYEIATLPDMVQNIELDKSDFGFDASVADFAKLYTYPYSTLEYVTSDGVTREIHIEDTGSSLAFASRLAEIDNTLSLQTFLADAGGYGMFDYSWQDTPKSLPKGLTQTLHVRGVPSFELVVTERQMLAADKVRDMAQKCREIETSYTNGARAENTVNLNTQAANATANANALAANATAQANAYTAADNTKTNADADATTTKTNNDDSAATTKGIAYRTAQVAHDNVTNIAAPYSDIIRAAASTCAVAIENAQRDKVFNDALADSNLQATLTNTNIDTNAAVAGGSIAANTTIGSAGVLTGAVSGMGIGSAIAPGVGTVVGALCGAISSAVPVGVSTVSTGYNSSLLLTKESTIGRATLDAIASKQTAADTALQAMSQASETYAGNAYINQRAILTEQADANLTGSNANADDAYNTSTSNYARSYTTALNINSNNNTAAKTIADATKGTSDNIANATLATGNANAKYARDAAVLNLQDSARTSYAGLTAELASAGLAPHRTVTKGDNQDAYGFTRAFDTVTVKTQSRDAILQAGRYFDLYGYAANRAYTPAPGTFAIEGRTRSYWRFSDVRGTNAQGGNSVRDAVFNILKSGVNVWASPEVIYSA
jgi:hypothetical protein